MPKVDDIYLTWQEDYEFDVDYLQEAVADEVDELMADWQRYSPDSSPIIKGSIYYDSAELEFAYPDEAGRFEVAHDVGLIPTERTGVYTLPLKNPYHLFDWEVHLTLEDGLWSVGVDADRGSATGVDMFEEDVDALDFIARMIAKAYRNKAENLTIDDLVD